MNQEKNDINQLANKLQKEFNILLENYNLTSDFNPPILFLRFPANLATDLRLLFSPNMSEIMENILIKSEHFTKMHKFVPPDVPSPTAEIKRINPFIVRFEGLLPFAYFFAYTIMSEIKKIKENPKY